MRTPALHLPGMAGYFPGQLRRGSTIGQVRVVVTRIEHDGTMQRRMVDTARQTDPRNWEDLAARALAAQAPYRPVPGTAVYLKIGRASCRERV